MSFIADRPQKIQRSEILLRFVLGQQTNVKEVVDPPASVLSGSHRPISGMIISESARTFLDIGLE